MNGRIKNLVAYIDERVDIKRFFKFGITGVLNTLVNFLVYTFCNEILKTDPKLSQTAAYSIATVNSYIINKNWTFNKRGEKEYSGDGRSNNSDNSGKSGKSEVLRFMLVNSVSMSLSILGIYIFHDRLGFNKYLCQIPVAFITTTANYFGNKIFVFRTGHSSKR